MVNTYLSNEFVLQFVFIWVNFFFRRPSLANVERMTNVEISKINRKMKERKNKTAIQTLFCIRKIVFFMRCKKINKNEFIDLRWLLVSNWIANTVKTAFQVNWTTTEAHCMEKKPMTRETTTEKTWRQHELREKKAHTQTQAQSSRE